MRRRYEFLTQDDVFKALSKVRDALLAARDGEEVDTVMNGILTFDERMKVGRRILIAECLLAGLTMDEIKERLNVGSATITHVARSMDTYEKCFLLLGERSKKVEREYKEKAHVRVGGSTRVKKPLLSTGFKRKQVKR